MPDLDDTICVADMTSLAYNSCDTTVVSKSSTVQIGPYRHSILKDSVSDTQHEGKVIQAKKKISEEKSRKMKGILLFTQTFLSQFFWHISTLPWQ